MICDFDDFHENNHRLDLLHKLKDANPAFKCTLFAVPGLGAQAFWDSVPDWCELAVHGWLHPDPHEAENWSYDQTMEVLAKQPAGFVDGFKAPGWQISNDTYCALDDLGWWVADQPYNDYRRPLSLRVHLLSPGASSGDDQDHWHAHVQDIGSNGMAETWPRLLARVSEAESFEFVSEVVQ